jgi:energy-coupling factor transport system substrate-specific component
MVMPVRELITVWGNTRQLVLIAVTAALYAAILIPFKVAIPLVPGLTEVRPANVIPIVCSLLFGPAAAWGSAIGNLVGDVYGGTFGPGSLFGFIGNFLYGYIPYRLWRALGPGEPVFERWPLVLRYFVVALVASAACGVVIGWGVDLLGLAPFAVLARIIALNNFVVSAILGPPLLLSLYRRVGGLGLLYEDVMGEDERAPARAPVLGAVLLCVAALVGLGGGIAVNALLYHGAPQEVGIAAGVAPFVVLILLGSEMI